MEASEETAGYRCPACGKDLYGWRAARHPIDGSKVVLDHCENCGLIVTRAPDPPDVAAELGALERDGGELIAANRKSFQGGIGGAQWAGLEPERRRLHLNPIAVSLLLDKQGVSVTRTSARFRLRGYTGMVQTLINAFTLRDNFARNARAGRYPRADRRARATYALDAFVTAAVAIPMAIIALPLELLGSLFGRGGSMRIEAVAIPSAKHEAESQDAGL